MRAVSRRIVGAFRLIDDVLDGLHHGDGVVWGDSIRETIDEAIRTYKREVEKMDEKVEKLERRSADYMDVRVCAKEKIRTRYYLRSLARI